MLLTQIKKVLRNHFRGPCNINSHAASHQNKYFTTTHPHLINYMKYGYGGGTLGRGWFLESFLISRKDYGFALVFLACQSQQWWGQLGLLQRLAVWKFSLCEQFMNSFLWSILLSSLYAEHLLCHIPLGFSFIISNFDPYGQERLISKFTLYHFFCNKVIWKSFKYYILSQRFQNILIFKVHSFTLPKMYSMQFFTFFYW